MVVTIDGPSGVGKSTVSRRVAAELGLPYLDTGATYRAATLAVLRAGLDPGDETPVERAVADATIGYDNATVTLDGDDVTDEIRSEAVTDAVSAVSALPGVRRIVVELQRRWVAARGGSAVVEGRDIGSVVFPEATVKIFLTAPAEIRAARRAGDDEVAGVDVETVAHQLERRDRIDSTRAVSPLRPAGDAVVLDTAALDADAVVDAVLALVDASERRSRYRG